MGRIKIDWPTKDKECFYKYERIYIQYIQNIQGTRYTQKRYLLLCEVRL